MASINIDTVRQEIEHLEGETEEVEYKKVTAEDRALREKLVDEERKPKIKAFYKELCGKDMSDEEYDLYMSYIKDSKTPRGYNLRQFSVGLTPRDVRAKEALHKVK